MISPFAVRRSRTAGDPVPFFIPHYSSFIFHLSSFMYNAQQPTQNDSLGIYVHVPFCAAKCPYCDFYSGRDLSLIPAYVNAVKEELRSLARAGDFTDRGLFSRPVASVYFGGGTPSLLPGDEIAGILQTVKETYLLQPDAEITLEVNPTLKERDAFFAAVAAAGVNRVSVGMQSALAEERRALGRRGTPEDVSQTVKAAETAGIDNVSLDIMLGIPGQTEESLRQSLDFALSLHPAHLSVYILKLEEGTPLFARREKLDLPDEDAAAELYLFTCRYLEEKGMRHYEISNFCFNNRVGRHNLSYWRCGEYLGVGPAAHSFISGKRFYYPRDLRAFIAGEPPVYDGDGGDAEETLMLSLRTDEGLDIPAFEKRFGIAPTAAFFGEAELLRKNGLLVYDNGILRLTDRGFLVSNSIIAALLAAL